MSKSFSTKPKLIVIVGSTASGKSALAIKIARKFNCEIVSADSRQIYRRMDIGTAKPPKKEMDEIKHNLIDIKNPNEEYTVADYKKDAVKAIGKIIKDGKLPILAGGTGLYIKAVVENLKIPEVKPNPALRKKLERRIGKEGLEKLFRELVEFDPEAAYIVDGKNPRRVIRALEIALTTKKPFSAQRKKGEPLFDALKIGITIPWEKLREKIETRVDEMVKDGLVNEVDGLIRKYGNKQIAFDAIGYREIISYLNGNITLPEATELIKKNTSAFAKRQMTWFGKDKEIKWIKNEKEAVALVKKFLHKM